MKYLSLCSGIEAASVAWHPLGWQPVAFAEIEPFPSAVLAHRFPGVPNWGDMTRFKEWPDATVDVIVGGTPCQSFSVAGLRKGLDDPRGNLALTYLGIADRYRPDWILWENVPGVLSSSGGRDFGAFLGGLGQLGYGWAYRVLDAQFVRTCSHPFAVPQRRRRVFVVGCLGSWTRAAAVLFDGESLRGNPPPRRRAGQGFARGFETGPQGGRLTDLAPTMDARAKDGPIRNQLGVGALIHCPPVVPQAVATPVAFDCKGTEVQFATDGSHPTLRSMGHNLSHQNAGGNAAVAQPIVMMERGRADGPSLETRQDGTANTILTPNGGRSGLGVGAVAFAENSRGEIRLQGGDGQVAPQLTTGGGKPGQGQSVIAQPWAVRRLTPTECERLQGFPDGWTDIPWRGKPGAPDGPRYKALGNSMAVNVMGWLGERIALVEGIE